jgi:hypothetical protein
MKVTVRNPEFARKGVWFFEQPEFFEYEGEEVRVKWATADELALSTGNPEFPFRLIQKNRIVKIDGKVFENKTKTITRVVKGSKGNEYTVTGSNGRWTCTCPGFQFRNSCKHTQEAV